MGKNQSAKTKKKRSPDNTLKVLFDISEAINTTRNLDELYAVIHKSLDEILNADNFYIALYDKASDSITFPYYADEKGEAPEEIIGLSKTASSTGMVIQNKKPMIFYNKDLIRLADQQKQKSRKTVGKIWLGVPLIIHDRVKGVIVVQSYTSASDYKKKDLELLDSVSRHIALAIERKKSDEKSAEQQHILEKILESLPVGIGLAQKRIFKWVNNEMVRMFGYQSKQDFEDKSTRMLYPDIDHYDVNGKKIYYSLVNNGTADYEIDMIKQDKTLFPVHIKLNCGDVSDPAAWTTAILTDISQRRLAEKEKYEKERLQGVLEMAGAVCHEINQPLQAILGFSELLLMGSESADKVDPIEKNNLASIKNQATRLGKITKKLSNITKYSTLDYPGDTKIVDIWGSKSDKNSKNNKNNKSDKN
ncbi:GAF domain-containing protein [Desulfobacula toluolica]|uniref:histidine kinase n=1 Tax=Desulfobacula toluolica (strain DSM 7467 / Tol2) TaxID=651182 RepID=K0NNC8_DESTT|nr:GAF domain-containing protein [Desulfobacula toluolica]CCK82140.1 two component system sensor histidine kinase, GAF region [Desulfobacula toluolica Tol2]